MSKFVENLICVLADVDSEDTVESLCKLFRCGSISCSECPFRDKANLNETIRLLTKGETND